MSIIKRLTATLHASVDKTVASIENHDAIIQATLATSRRSVAEVKVKLSRVQADVKKQELHIKELNKRIDLWTARAKAIADTDRDKALECLKQRQADQTQLENAHQTLKKYQEMAQQMEDRVGSLQHRVTTLQQQHTELQSRDTVSRATACLDELEYSPSMNVNDTIDRWKVSIQQREAQIDHYNDVVDVPTTLHEELKVQEQKAQLNDELEALLKTEEVGQ